MVGFEGIFNFAMQLKRIEDIKLHLRTNFNGILLVALYFEDANEEKKRKKEFFNRTSKIVKDLNSEIKKFNKYLNKYFTYLNSRGIEQVDLNKIKEIISEHKEITSLAREHTILKLNNCLIKTNNSIENVFSSFHNLYFPFGGKNKKFELDELLFKIIKEAFDIYSLGYFETSVFLIGKGLEYTITKFLKKCLGKKKIPYTLKDLKKWTFHKKIDILNEEELISKSDYSKIMSVKWDRNISGHPSRKRELIKLRDDADAIIKIGLNKILDFHNRMKPPLTKQKSKKEK